MLDEMTYRLLADAESGSQARGRAAIIRYWTQQQSAERRTGGCGPTTPGGGEILPTAESTKAPHAGRDAPEQLTTTTNRTFADSRARFSSRTSADIMLPKALNEGRLAPKVAAQAHTAGRRDSSTASTRDVGSTHGPL